MWINCSTTCWMSASGDTKPRTYWDWLNTGTTTGTIRWYIQLAEQRAEQIYCMRLLAKQENKSLGWRQLAAVWFKRQPWLVFFVEITRSLALVWCLFGLCLWNSDLCIGWQFWLSSQDWIFTILLHAPFKGNLLGSLLSGILFWLVFLVCCYHLILNAVLIIIAPVWVHVHLKPEAQTFFLPY